MGCPFLYGHKIREGNLDFLQAEEDQVVETQMETLKLGPEEKMRAEGENAAGADDGREKEMESKRDNMVDVHVLD